MNRKAGVLTIVFGLMLCLGVLSSPVLAGELFAAGDTEDFGFDPGVTTCPGGEPCDKIASVLVDGAAHVSTTILPTTFLVNGMADAGGVLLTGTPAASVLNTVSFQGDLISSIAAPGIPQACCNEEMVFVPQNDGPDKVYHAHWSDVIREIDPLTGEELAVFPQTDVVGMALVNGEIWISKWGPRQIGIWNPGDNSFSLQIQNAALSALGNTGALAFDPFEQVLWVGSTGGLITPFDLSGTQLGASIKPFADVNDTIDGLTFLGEVTDVDNASKPVPATGTWAALLILLSLLAIGLFTIRRLA